MSEPRFLPHALLGQLLQELNRIGYGVIGPQVRDGAIVFAALDDMEQLPRGVRDLQAPGHYRVTNVDDRRCFAFACGPQALKPLLFRGRELLWSAVRDARGFHTHTAIPATERPLAIIGVRACDLRALTLHDAHFLGGEHPDLAYAARRAGLFLVAVNCSHPATTCFCASTGDGPEAHSGYDLLLDELEDGYVLRAGSEAGKIICDRLDVGDASAAQQISAVEQRRAAARFQTRSLPGRNLQGALFANLDHPQWAQVAARCLSCGNCTAVCPTCFCHSHVEDAALDGSTSHHYRVWDSCFTEGHSYIHGIVIRADTAKRYRQWLTHKLGAWHEQYGRSGCVGCGRCITWCPASIDLTAEVAAIVGERV